MELLDHELYVLMEIIDEARDLYYTQIKEMREYNSFIIDIGDYDGKDDNVDYNVERIKILENRIKVINKIMKKIHQETRKY